MEKITASLEIRSIVWPPHYNGEWVGRKHTKIQFQDKLVRLQLPAAGYYWSGEHCVAVQVLFFFLLFDFYLFLSHLTSFLSSLILKY